MELFEVSKAFGDIKRQISAKADLYISLNLVTYESTDLLTASVYPEGLCGDRETNFSVHGKTFEELLDNLKEDWARRSESFGAHVITAMALAVIRITDDQGECTDASLVYAGFDKEKITKYSKKAATKANNMAAGGPFKVILGKVNEAAE